MPEIVRPNRQRAVRAGSDGMPLEREIQRDIRAALGLLPDLVLWRNSVAGVQEWDPVTGRTRVMHAGLPIGSADLVGILRPGRFIALEVKRPTGKPRPDQRQWLELVRMYGGFACVVDSVSSALAAIDRARRGDVE